jgi:hypothetical protein
MKTGIFKLRGSNFTSYYDVRLNGCLIRTEFDDGEVLEEMFSVYVARSIWKDEVKAGARRVQR